MRYTLYVLTYNCPRQFEYWVQQCREVQRAAARKVLIDNTNLPSLTPEYEDLCRVHGFEHVKLENHGIMGGRVAAAEHFVNDDDAPYCVYFEDDYITHEPIDAVCRSGFPMHVDGWLDKSLRIATNEGLHYLKLCFSEVYYDNDVQVSWFNLSQADRERYFPGAQKPPATKFTGENVLDGLGYLTGEVFWCAWPQIMSREGCRFLLRSDIRGRFGGRFRGRARSEMYAMAELYKQTVSGHFRGSVLKATLASHDRRFDYNRETRML